MVIVTLIYSSSSNIKICEISTQPPVFNVSKFMGAYTFVFALPTMTGILKGDVIFRQTASSSGNLKSIPSRASFQTRNLNLIFLGSVLLTISGSGFISCGFPGSRLKPITDGIVFLDTKLPSTVNPLAGVLPPPATLRNQSPDPQFCQR